MMLAAQTIDQVCNGLCGCGACPMWLYFVGYNVLLAGLLLFLLESRVMPGDQ